jgi:hypothetical protein
MTGHAERRTRYFTILAALLFLALPGPAAFANPLAAAWDRFLDKNELPDNSTGLTFAATPLKSIASRSSSAAFFAELTAWSKTHLLAPFIARLPADAPWRSRAVAWMEEALPLWCSFRGSDPNLVRESAPLERLFIEAAALDRDGCKDPFFQAVHGGLFLRAKGSRSAGYFICHSASLALKQTDPGPLASFIIIGQYASAYRDYHSNDYQKEKAALAAWQAQFAPDALASPAWNNHEAVLAFFLNDRRFGRLFWEPDTPLTPILDASSAPSWIKTLIAARRKFRAAWDARGGGFAHTVTEEGWKLFYKYLEEAEAILLPAWKERPDRPEIATLMLDISLGCRGNALAKGRLWLERTVEAEFDHLPAYVIYLWMLRDRWYGDARMREAFALECLDTARYDTGVPAFALEAGLAQADDSRLAADLHFSRDTAARLLAMQEAYLASAANDDTRLLWCSHAAFQAFSNGQFSRAQEWINAAGGSLHPSLHPRFSLVSQSAAHFPARVAIAAGANGANGASLISAENLLRQGRVGEALAQLDRLSAPEGTPAADYLAALIQAGKSIAAFQSGQPAPLTSQAGGLPWMPLRGPWLLDTPGAIVFNGAENSAQILYPAAPGGDFDLSLDYEYISSFHNEFHIGFLLGRGEGTEQEGVFIVARISMGDKHELQVSSPFRWDSQTYPFTGKHPKSGTALLQVRGRQVTLRINGQEVVQNLDLSFINTLPPGPLGESRFGFGVYYGGSKVAYKNIVLLPPSTPVTPPPAQSPPQ